MAQNFIIGKMFTWGQKMLESINKKAASTRLLVWEPNPVQLMLNIY